MKRRIYILCLIAVICLFQAFLPCYAEENPLKIVAANFPSFDLARSLCADTAWITMMLPPGSESHSYEPSPQDIIMIQQADLFIYTGGESDHWINEILLSMGNDAPAAFCMLDYVHVLEEELSASMQHTHSHEHIHDESCEHESDVDEHVWTSPRNVMLLTEGLCQKLCMLRPEKRDLYETEAKNYLAKLQQLDETFRQIVAESSRDLLIFGDRFPLRYFANEYGLRYDAAFPGCSEDSEPSVKTVISLIDTIREQNIPVVCYIEFSSRRTADILAEETDAVPMLFHSCHNVSAEEIDAGATYLSLMWNNTEVLKEALN